MHYEKKKMFRVAYWQIFSSCKLILKSVIQNSYCFNGMKNNVLSFHFQEFFFIELW